MYRNLNAGRIVETAEQLHRRITERFPDSGLGRVAGEVVEVARRASATSDWLARPHWPLRLTAGFCLLVMILVVAGAVTQVDVEMGQWTLGDILQAVEAAINDVVFLGIAIFFLASWENRIKRGRALKAVHELRSLAHVIDMHQLTKDPESLTKAYAGTASSPGRGMTPFELARYLDYCSEALSILSKVAALYVQKFEDPGTLSAVNDLESLTTGLSRKIWHKLVILDRIPRP